MLEACFFIHLLSVMPSVPDWLDAAFFRLFTHFSPSVTSFDTTSLITSITGACWLGASSFVIASFVLATVVACSDLSMFGWHQSFKEANEERNVFPLSSALVLDGGLPYRWCLHLTFSWWEQHRFWQTKYRFLHSYTGNIGCVHALCPSFENWSSPNHP